MLFRKSFSYLLIGCTWLLLLTACRQPDRPEAPASTEIESQESQEPTEEAVAETIYASYQNPVMGLTLAYPENWVAYDSFSGLTLASSQAVIDSESLADIGEDAFVTIIPGELSLFNFQAQQSLKAEDAVQALLVYKSLLEREGQSFQAIEPPIPLKVNSDSSVFTVLRTEEDGQTLIMLMSVIINDGQVAFITAASHEDTAVNLRPTFDHILNSVQLSAPAVDKQ